MPRDFVEFAPAGFNSDLAPYTVPPSEYTAAFNVRFNGSRAERFGGAAVVFDDAQAYIGPPRWAATTIINGLPWILYLGDWGVAVTNGTNHYNVTPAGWQAPPAPGSVTGCTINNIICFTHIDVVPYYWDGNTVAGSVKPLPGFLANTRCRILRAFRQNLFAGDILSAGGRQQDRVLWSDFAPVNAVPPTWTPTATNGAGEMLLSDGLGAVLEMQPMHDFLMVYKAGAAYAISFVGRPYIFSQRRMAAAVGAISNNAVCVLRGSHVVCAQGDIVIADGSSVRSIIDQRIRQAILPRLNPAAVGVICNVHYPARNEVWIGLPLDNSEGCNFAAIWNYVTDKWTVRQLPNVESLSLTVIRPNFIPLIWSAQAQSWAATSGNWSAVKYGETLLKVIGCAPDQPGIIAFDESDTELGQNLVGEVQRLSLPIGGTDRMKFVDAIFPRVSGGVGTQVTVRVGTQRESSDPIVWQGPRTFTVQSGLRVQGIPVRASCRFLSVEIRGTQLAPWTVDGFGVRYRLAGRQ
jgi:hypothetical protein